MDIQSLMDSDLFAWIIMPFMIFLARICDQTIGTIRIVYLSQGDKIIAPILGFFEVLIWVLAIRQIIYNISNVAGYFAYAGGFATGNFIGVLIEQKIAMGKRVVQIITQRDASKLVESLTQRGFGVTNIPAESKRRKVNVIYTVIERMDLNEVLKVIEQCNPNAFYSVENVLAVKEGIFPSIKRNDRGFFSLPPRFYRQLRILWDLRKLRKEK